MSSRLEVRIIVWLEEVDTDDATLVGGKAANLGELIRANVAVPSGFCVTVDGFRRFVDSTSLSARVGEVLRAVDYSDSDRIEEASKRIRQFFRETALPSAIIEAITAAYSKLGDGKECPVAVRSSASAEDSPHASFAGQHETYLNVRGIDDILAAVRNCFGSLFTYRSMVYRHQNRIKEDGALCVIVQQMVKPRTSGVAFTIHPATGDSTIMVVEGSWGLGESVVAGQVTPDHFEINKSNFVITNKIISTKRLEVVENTSGTGTIQRELPEVMRRSSCLTDSEVVQIAKVAKMIEEHFGKPQDIEWAIGDSSEGTARLFILQSRPETHWSR